MKLHNIILYRTNYIFYIQPISADQKMATRNIGKFCVTRAFLIIRQFSKYYVQPLFLYKKIIYKLYTI